MISVNPTGVPELACNECGSRYFDRQKDCCYECGAPVLAEEIAAYRDALYRYQQSSKAETA